MIYERTFLLDCPFELIHDSSIQINDKTTLIHNQQFQLRYASLLFWNTTIQFNCTKKLYKETKLIVDRLAGLFFIPTTLEIYTHLVCWHSVRRVENNQLYTWKKESWQVNAIDKEDPILLWQSKMGSFFKAGINLWIGRKNDLYDTAYPL